MLIAPNIDPVALALGPVKIHWYGLMYVLGFFSLWFFASRRARRPGSGWTVDDVGVILFYGALGVILGGRLGYVFIYNFSHFAAHPLDAFKIWEGGMSFHGGLAGVGVALWVFARQRGRTLLQVADFVTPWVPIGIGAVRIANFINHELWGRVTDVPWGMVFRNGGPLPRHPSQLYEAALEGLVMFIILWLYTRKPRPTGSVLGLFLVFYGVFRFAVEFVREPDVQMGYVLGVFTTGQLLSAPMVIIGIALLWWSHRRAASAAVS